jgi:hypothetical protein
MVKNIIKLDAIGKTDPFNVPEGYFENFITEIMSKLPERPVEKPKVINLWERAKPWIYMAAIFVGVALMINFVEKGSNKRQDIASSYASKGLKLNSSNDIEDFYRYYEDELTKVVYDDAMADFQDDSANVDNDK